MNRRSIAVAAELARAAALMACTTISEIASSGRARVAVRRRDAGARAFATPPASTTSRGARHATRIGPSLDPQPLHAVAQRAEGDAEQLGGGGAVEARLLERLEDRLLLDVVEIVLQRPLVAGGQRARRTRRRPRRQVQVVGA